jgi:uncharacterized protein
MSEPSLWQWLGIAFALLLIVEGIMPFLNPSYFRDHLHRISQLNNSQLRTIGFLSMVFGLILLYWVH